VRVDIALIVLGITAILNYDQWFCSIAQVRPFFRRGREQRGECQRFIEERFAAIAVIQASIRRSGRRMTSDEENRTPSRPGGCRRLSVVERPTSSALAHGGLGLWRTLAYGSLVLRHLQ